MGTDSRSAGGKFRTKRNYFSMVSNNALRDPELSLRAKGLYSLIQSYITIEGFTLYKNFLISQSKDSHNTFDLGWKELKQKGYLIQYRVNGENGHINYEYELLDTPEIPQPKNEGVADPFLPQPKKPLMAKPYDGKTTNGVVGCISNTDLNNTYNNNTVPYHIFSELDIKRQLGLDGYEEIDNITNEIVSLMAEVLNMNDSALIRINKQDMQVSVVKARFRKVEYKHVEYIKFVISQFSGEVRNVRAFMLTTIYNAVTTCDVYFTTKVNHDLYSTN